MMKAPIALVRFQEHVLTFFSRTLSFEKTSR
jgi:hypothetical protein